MDKIDGWMNSIVIKFSSHTLKVNKWIFLSVYMLILLNLTKNDGTKNTFFILNNTDLSLFCLSSLLSSFIKDGCKLKRLLRCLPFILTGSFCLIKKFGRVSAFYRFFCDLGDDFLQAHHPRSNEPNKIKIIW